MDLSATATSLGIDSAKLLEDLEVLKKDVVSFDNLLRTSLKACMNYDITTYVNSVDNQGFFYKVNNELDNISSYFENVESELSNIKEIMGINAIIETRSTSDHSVIEKAKTLSIIFMSITEYMNGVGVEPLVFQQTDQLVGWKPIRSRIISDLRAYIKFWSELINLSLQ